MRQIISQRFPTTINNTCASDKYILKDWKYFLNAHRPPFPRKRRFPKIFQGKKCRQPILSLRKIPDTIEGFRIKRFRTFGAIFFSPLKRPLDIII